MPQPTITNPHAARLEALMSLLLGAQTDEELEAAKKQAAVIAQMSDDEIQSLSQEPEQYDCDEDEDEDEDSARPINPPLQYALRSRHGKPGHPDAEALAWFYADLLGSFDDAGHDYDDATLVTIDDELGGSGFRVNRDDLGRWHVQIDETGRMPFDDDDEPDEEDEDDHDPIDDGAMIEVHTTSYGRSFLDVLRYQARRVPLGSSLTLRGVTYRGGQWLAPCEVARLSKSQLASLDRAEQEAAIRADERARQYIRDGYPDQYRWVRDTKNPKTGRPYSPRRWMDDQTGEIKYSDKEPGTGRTKKAPEAPSKPTRAPKKKPATESAEPDTSGLSATEKRSAAASLRALQRHHGENVAGRIKQLMTDTEKAMGKAKDEGKKAGLKSQLGKLGYLLKQVGGEEKKKPAPVEEEPLVLDDDDDIVLSEPEDTPRVTVSDDDDDEITLDLSEPEPELDPNPIPIAERIKSSASAQQKVKRLAGIKVLSYEERNALHQEISGQVRALNQQESELMARLQSSKTKAWDKPAIQKQINDIDSRRSKLRQDQDDLFNDTVQKKKVANEQTRQALLLPENMPSHVIQTSSIDAQLESWEQSAAKEGAQWLTGLLVQGGAQPLPPYRIKYDEESPRAYYRHHEGAVNMRGATVAVAVHEYCHALEYHDPAIRRAVRDFLKYRVGNEPSRKMNDAIPSGGYRDNEVGRKDHFDRAFDEESAYYIGKDYGDLPATEVLSMGVQKLYEDPAGFAQKDPEYCAFIVGIMDGSIR